MGIRESKAYQTVAAQLRAKCEARDRAVGQLLREPDVAGIRARAARIRDFLRTQLDTSELRGDAAPQSAGALELPGYRIEKLWLRGVMGMRIPVNLYLPRAGTPPYPAVLVPLGHWKEAKARPDNQIFCANLALRGVAAITYDPIFQGERCPCPEEELLPLFGPASEDIWVVALHMRAGNLAYLLDRNLGAFFMAEAQLVLDYLCARDDIDAARVGVVGQSGGGTQSCYLAALDDRVSFYAPVQCISRLSATLADGIGDCEQSLLRSSAAEAMEQCDPMWAAAPKPVLQSSAQQDFFDITGARSAARELSQLYDALGAGGAYRFQTADCGHEFGREAREQIYGWLGDLLGLSCAPREEPISLRSFDALRCLPGGFTPEEHPMRAYRPLLREQRKRRPSAPAALRAALNALVLAWSDGETAVHPAGENVFDVSVRPGRRTRCAWSRKPGAPLVIAAGVQKTPLDINASILYIVSWGEASFKEKQTRGYDAETCLFNALGVLGENCAAQRAREILAAADFAMRQAGTSRCTVVAEGASALPALLAACMDARLSGPILSGIPLSLDAMFDEPRYFLRETDILPGLLALADLPALFRLCGAHLVGPRAADGSVCEIKEAEERSGVRCSAPEADAGALLRRAIEEGTRSGDPDRPCHDRR